MPICSAQICILFFFLSVTEAAKPNPGMIVYMHRLVQYAHKPSRYVWGRTRNIAVRLERENSDCTKSVYSKMLFSYFPSVESTLFI